MASERDRRRVVSSAREKIGIGRLSLLFHYALQGVLVLACVIHHLRHLGLRALVAKDAAFAYTVVMHLKHDLHRFLSVLIEEGLQNGDHELHGRVVVVEQKYAILIWTFLLRPRACYPPRARPWRFSSSLRFARRDRPHRQVRRGTAEARIDPPRQRSHSRSESNH